MKKARRKIAKAPLPEAVDHGVEVRGGVMAAARIATEMVADAARRRGTRVMSFSVIDDRKPTPFLTHWRLKNISGVTFAKTATAEAEEWIAVALLAGYDVCSHWGRRYWGGCVRCLDERMRNIPPITLGKLARSDF
jgi:hypothetical protein